MPKRLSRTTDSLNSNAHADATRKTSNHIAPNTLLPPTTGAGRASTSVFQLSELDQRILQLNYNGFSCNKISKLLKKLHGIELSKAGVTRHLTELRQDPENDVRANYIQRGGKPKTENRWYNIILKLKEEIDTYIKIPLLKEVGKEITEAD